MKVRSKIELVDFLANRKQARKRELVSLIHDLKRSKEKDISKFCRFALVLAYAHWEGFVKDAARAYVQFVSYKSRKLVDLNTNFQALACRQELIIANKATRRIAPHISVVRRFTERISESCNLNPTDSIDTESNLTSVVFQNICDCIGLDFVLNWSTDGPFIDDLFLNRCAVAHGELYTPPLDYSLEVLDFAIKAIDCFSTEIENAALQDSYLREKPGAQPR